MARGASNGALAAATEDKVATGRHQQQQYSFPAGDGRHKRRLAVSGIVLFATALVLPITLYYVLKYVTRSPEQVVLAVPLAIFGASSALSYCQRTWSLGRRNSTTRPIGGPRWGFDFFHWNFTFGFLYNVAIQCAADSKPGLIRVGALPLALLVISICAQLVLTQIAALNTRLRYFCRVSSMPKGAGPIRSPLYTIVEDVVAVDGMQGTAWRLAFNERYESDPALGRVLFRLGWLWGLTGVVVGVVDLVLIFVLPSVDAAWVVGWTLPWVWAVGLSVLTYLYVQRELRD